MRRASRIVGWCAVWGLSLLSGRTPVAPAGEKPDEAFVTTPQVALIWKTNQAPVQVWLVRLTPQELTFTPSASNKHEQTIKAAGGGVVGIQLANGDIFKYRSSKRDFAHFDPLQRSFVDDKTPEASPETLTHEAEGSGTTGDEAIRDALRNAVRAAVGVLVEGEVLVKQEDVISDKVLTYSDGFVSSYDVLKREQKDGLVHIRIRAHVERRKLLADLRTAGVSLNAVDGKGLVASAITRKEAVDAEVDVLKKSLALLPNLLQVEVKPPTALDYQIETQRLPLSITVRIDRNKYIEFAGKLDSVLSKMSLAHAKLILHSLPAVGTGDHSLDWARANLDPAIHYGPALPGNPKTWCLWLAARADDRHHTFQLSCHVLDGDIAQVMAPTRGKLRVEVTLLDAQKEVITRQLFDPEFGGKLLSYWFGWANPRPRLLRADYSDTAAASLLGSKNLTDLRPAVNADNTVNVFVLPVCVGGIEASNSVLYTRGIWLSPSIQIEPEKLNRMTEVRARVVFEATSGSNP
jgi:hypothetical protein